MCLTMQVTQCLGALSPVTHWYMAVAQPTANVQDYPKEEDLTVFRIPHGVFVKMNPGTWHAGKLEIASGQPSLACPRDVCVEMHGSRVRRGTAEGNVVICGTSGGDVRRKSCTKAVPTVLGHNCSVCVVCQSIRLPAFPLLIKPPYSSHQKDWLLVQ